MNRVEELVGKCLAGRQKSPMNIKAGHIRSYYSSSQSPYLSPFAVYCDFHVDGSEQDPETKFGNLLIKFGKELEERYADSLDPDMRQKVYMYSEDGFRIFLEDCFSGAKYIYNPPLWFFVEELEGKPDILKKDDSAKSVFGDYHYRVIEVKNSSFFSKPDKKSYLYQAAFYNHLLGEIQGYIPPSFMMVNRNCEVEEFQYSMCEKELMDTLKSIAKIRDGELLPEPIYDDKPKHHWSFYCNSKAIEADDISLVPKVTQSIREQMVGDGIKKVSDLARLNVGQIVKYKGVGKKTAEIIAVHARALEERKPIIYRKESLTLPQKCDVELFVDVEDTAYIHPSVKHYVYLIGVVVKKEGRVMYKPFLARVEAEVPKMLKQFVDFLKKTSIKVR